MKLALLIGNRFNPWHFQAYPHLRPSPAITVFRAESEIQQRFAECDDAALPFTFERIFFDTQGGNPLIRAVRATQTRFLNRAPRILPFFERLREFDVIQSWELFTDWSAQAALAREQFGIPLVVMVWDNIPFNHEQDPARAAIKRRVLTQADRFVVHTERSRRMLLLEGAPADRIVLVNPGVDTERFSPGEPVSKAFERSPDDFTILFVGWFLPRKGLDFLLFALRELLDDAALRPHKIRLVMVGSGPGKERIERLIQRLGVGPACTFVGALPYGTMPNVYRAADVFVLPSIATPQWQEQFGMSIIEAMASGTPVVTTRSGAIPEIVGDSAILCPPNDFVSLADALRRLILNPAQRQALAASGRARALDRFTLPQLAHGLSDVYDRIRRPQREP